MAEFIIRHTERSNFYRQGTLVQIFASALEKADIRINGSRPWDIRVYNERLYPRVLAEGSVGLGEAYMDGWWDADDLEGFFYRLLRGKIPQQFQINAATLFHFIESRLINLQSPSRAYEVGLRHYDLSQGLYQCMLDKRMVYSCAYWENAATLDEAQEAKLDLICRKLYLQPGMEILDIGCGWGALASFAAERYGVKVVGITVSKEQWEYASKKYKDLPVEFLLQDYREINRSFDRVVSVGMFEHVGYKNYRTFMEKVNQCLKDDGIFLLHTIGNNISVTAFDPWMNKYIFPNAMIPSIKQIAASIEGLFVMEDWQNLSTDYAKTLRAWHQNFERHWPEIHVFYDERFYRMWRYYLLSCAATFQARDKQVWQIVLSKGQAIHKYKAVR